MFCILFVCGINSRTSIKILFVSIIRPKYEFYMNFTLSAIRFMENENLQSDFMTV